MNCPTCGDNFDGLGRHWTWNEECRPSLTDRQRDVVIGLLMGDGSLHRSSTNPSVDVKMITPEYLEYLSEEFGVLSTDVRLCQTAKEHCDEIRESGFRPDAEVENYHDVYRWRTRCHPELNEFSSWYNGGDKCWPEDIELTPTVLTHWYCGDGHWSNDGTRDYITISMVNERNNKDKVEGMFERSDLPKPSRWGEGEDVFYAAWNKQGSDELFEYMNGPVPGFEYKFNNDF